MWGPIVYIQQNAYHVSSQSPLLVIDGQQRLTTVTLLLAALARSLDTMDEANREPVDGFRPGRSGLIYLLNSEEEGERRFKLLLSQTDKASLLAIVRGTESPKESSVRVTEKLRALREVDRGEPSAARRPVQGPREG